MDINTHVSQMFLNFFQPPIPFKFHFCAEILLCKLILEVRIRSISLSLFLGSEGWNIRLLHRCSVSLLFAEDTVIYGAYK
jgi:hypothetical protein